MHGFAETAATFAFMVAAWPLIAATVAAELVCRVRWRLLWSTDADWFAKFRNDVRMVLALWRADMKRLFTAD